jgi:hypothetical protein
MLWPLLSILIKVLFRLAGTGMTVGGALQDVLLVEVGGHCSDRGRSIGRWSSPFSSVVFGVISVGSSALPIEGEASVVLVPECSMIAERCDCGIPPRGIVRSIFFCLRVLGIKKECAEKEARKLLRRF